MKILSALMIAALPAAVLAQAPLPVGSVTLSSPATIAEVDMNKLKGQPSRMGWSADGKEIYLQTIEGAFHEPKAIRHYMISATDGKVKDVEAEPAWFAPYWAVKSHKASPDVPSTEIALETEQRRETATSVPRGGEMARGGVDAGSSGTSAEDVLKAAHGSQTSVVYTMKLHGQTIGEFVNSVLVPGLTFAWAPKGSKAIAYAELKGGRLVLMDPDGKRQTLDGTKDALLPMWSHDATQLAWLQKDGKKKYELKVATVK